MELFIIMPLLLLFIIIAQWAFISKVENQIHVTLRSYGYRVIAITRTGLFNTGPFPKFSMKVQPFKTNIPGVTGEQTFYRKVVAINPESEKLELWVKVKTIAFMISNMEFSPEIDSHTT